MKKEYVAGLLYCDEGLNVALIAKNRPDWQAGLFNAIGGKIEFGETPHEAMRREFIEEAGVPIEWNERFVLEGPDFRVHFFSCHNSEALSYVGSMTDEVVNIFEAYDLPENLIPNLWWIVPMMNDDSVVPQTIRVLG